jgi:hypothetical protein
MNLGKREGFGRMNYANGDYYVGNWRADKVRYNYHHYKHHYKATY